MISRLTISLCSIISLLLGVASTFLPAIGVAQSGVKPPNIVFLLADDQAFSTLGCYGNADVQTPNIDALAAAGMAFDSHYNTTAICMASRANILTGRYEYRNGCNFDHGDLPQELWAKSYPMLLKAAGYRTAMAGKIGMEVEGVGLPQEDFDVWGAGPGQTHYRTAKNSSMAQYAKEFPHSSTSYGAFGRDFIASSAKNSEQPFCLSISFKAPHHPTTPDPQFDHVYAGKKFTKPANYGRENGEHFAEQSKVGRQYERFHSWHYSDRFDEVMATYHQQIYGIDVAVGMITEALKEHGVADNTIVIYTSDNGFFNGSHGYGSKVLPYEEGARVPLIIADPRRQDAMGRRSGALTGNIDLYTTILEIAGVETPEGVDGVSLLPLLAKPDTEVREQLALMNFWGPEAARVFGVVTPTFKYIHWAYGADGMEPTDELYDMKTDRLEMKNLAVNPEKAPALQEMQRLYDNEVSRISAESIRDSHKRYGVLFDRTKSWADKIAEAPKPTRKKPAKPKNKMKKGEAKAKKVTE